MEKNEINRLWKLFVIFFKIGAFTIGGGLAMLPLIEREVVQNSKMVNEEDIVDIFAICQSLPGVIAINSAIFIGYKVGGGIGALVAALGVILPSFIIILIIAFIMFNIQGITAIEKALTGVRAGVTAMILLTVAKLSKSVIKNRLSLLLAIAAFACIAFFDLHAIVTILAGGLTGFLVYRLHLFNKAEDGREGKG